jgi:hypothetical protein
LRRNCARVKSLDATLFLPKAIASAGGTGMMQPQKWDWLYAGYDRQTV